MSAFDQPAWRLLTTAGDIVLSDEKDGTPRDWRHVEHFSGNCRATSQHGLAVDGVAVALFAAAGGATGVHRHSAVWHDGFLYLAVGNRVCCLQPKPYRLRWSAIVDPATCFGVHYDAAHDAFISHGELAIARFSVAGQLLWSRSGADIFSRELSLRPHCVEAIDFDGRRYGFDYTDGRAVEP